MDRFLKFQFLVQSMETTINENHVMQLLDSNSCNNLRSMPKIANSAPEATLGISSDTAINTEKSTYLSNSINSE